MALEKCFQDMILRIYRMELFGLAQLAVFSALIFCTIYRKWYGRRWLRICIGLALAAWLGGVLWMTLLSRNGGSAVRFDWIMLHTYWRVLCGENRELIRSAFMNVVLFFPGGLLLAALMPEKWSFRQGMCCAIVVFMAFGLFIELSQYFRQLGTAEIDDVLHNTLGAGLGYAAFHLDLDNKTQ